MDITETPFSFIDLIFTSLMTLLAAWLAPRHTKRPEKQATARLMFEKCYSPIFTLLEHDLFRADLSHAEVQKIGHNILEICDNSQNYYYPTIKVYSELLIISNSGNYQEIWEDFSNRFSRQYDLICKEIGLPLRNQEYRIYRGHFQTRTRLILLMIKNKVTINLLIVLFVYFIGLIYWFNLFSLLR